MKKIFFTISVLITLLTTITFSYSNEKIIFINFDYIVDNSMRGKSIFNDLNKIKNENIKKLEVDQKKLKDQENDIKLKKDIISKDELDKQVKLLKDNVKKFREKKNSMENELNKLHKKKMNEFVSQINVVLEKYMKDQSVDIMLNSKNILIGKKSTNKTQEILKLINTNIK